MKWKLSVRSLLNIVLIGILTYFLFTCASGPPPLKGCRDYPFDPVAKRITPEVLEKYPLTYTRILKDVYGQALLKIDVEYTGRCPDLSSYDAEYPYNGPDYNNIRTSFYKRTMENLTDYPIMRRSLTVRKLLHSSTTTKIYRIDKQGNPYKEDMPTVFQVDYLKKPFRLGNVLLKPKEKKTHEMFFYGNAGMIWERETTISINDKEYTYFTHQVAH